MRNLSPVFLTQLTKQESEDPFLLLVELSHTNFGSVYLVNNSVNVTSNGNEYMAFPMEITLPVDDGTTEPSVQIVFDNVSRELVDEIRNAVTQIDVNIKGVLASNPDYVEIEVGEMKLTKVSYNSQRISAVLAFDDFLNTELP